MSRLRPAPLSPTTISSRAGDLSVTARRTIAAPATATFAAWADPRRRARWFIGVPLILRRTTAGRTLLLTCGDDHSDIDVHIAPRGRGRCVVTVNHRHLATAQLVAERRHCWKEMLAALKHYLERPA